MLYFEFEHEVNMMYKDFFLICPGGHFFIGVEPFQQFWKRVLRRTIWVN